MKRRVSFILIQAMMAFCALIHSSTLLARSTNPSQKNAFTICLSSANKTSNLKDFNAVGDGLSDDTIPMIKWLASAQPGTCLYAPPGTYAFSAPLSISTANIAIVGAGPYQTTFKYTGATSDVDLLYIGSPLQQTANVFLEGFKIQSASLMTKGAGLHLQGVVRSQLRDIVADGQDGNGFLCHGIWFDRVDFVRLDDFEARGSQDAIRVNGTVGSGPKADLYLTGGKIALSNVGIHIGGAFGGIIVDNSDIIENNTNVLVDTAIVNEENRELFFNSGCMVDSAVTGDGFLINDSLVTNGTLYIGGWVASSAQNGIHVEHWNGAISIESPTIFNCKEDGILIEDPASIVSISTSTLIRNNGGYGVNSTVPTNTITPGAPPVANTLGGYAPNTHIDFENSQSGYHKFANGRILQWVTTTFTGPANTVLSPNGGNPIPLPIAFPNQTDANTLVAQPYGFANGPMFFTATASPFSNSGVYVNLIASGAVINPQIVQVTVWGW
jgi:Pectate lyase superfamily protein